MSHPHAINALFGALADLVVPNSCDIVVIDGALDHARLERAIEATLAAHPILARDAPIDLRVHHLEHDRAAVVDAHLVRSIWDEPFAPGDRPIRFHVTVTPARTYFQTIHTHVYADSTACYTITQQIAAAYASRASEATTAPRAPRPTLFGSTRERVGHLARAAVATARDLATAHGGLAVRERPRRGRRKLARFVLSASETEQLKVAARARGRTLHGFFQLAFLRAATSFNRARGVERPTLRIWDFFSMRPAIEKSGQRPFYDCLALIYPVDMDARWTDEAVLQNCTRVVEEMRARDLGMHASRLDALLRLVPGRAFSRIRPFIFKSNVFFTNPGVVPTRLERFGDKAVVDYVTFPQLFAPADVMFVFSTFRDRLRVLVVYDEDALGGALHGDLFAPFLSNLGALAGLDFSRAVTSDGFVASWVAPPRQARDLAPSPMKVSA